MASSPSSESTIPSFIPANTWRGSKPGYYFGTTKEKGTGYHLDEYQQKKVKVLQQGGKHKIISQVDKPSAKRAKRSVVFAEEKNEVREIPNNSSDLLKEAEAAAQGVKVLELSPKGVQAGIKQLERACEKNLCLRAEHTGDPSMYMDSELALYEAITSLQPIAADPSNLYPPLLNEGELWTSTFSQLAMHENSDVVSSLVALLLELLDPSLLNMEQPNQHPSNRYILLVGRAIMDHLMELLVSNLTRLQNQGESSTAESDTGLGKGVEDVLSLIENLLEMDLTVQNKNETNDDDAASEVALVADGGSVAAKIVKETPFLSWLFLQINDGTASKDRSLELLAFLVQREEVHSIHPDWTKLSPYRSVFDESSNEDARKKEKEKNNESHVVDGIEILLLHGIAPFKKKQPANESEVEALENSCIALEASLTFSPTNVRAFLDAQGIELVLRCLKEKVHAGGVALKLLDFSGSDPVYQKACEHLVAEAGGLKYLFPLLMGRQIPKPAIVSWANEKTKNGEGDIKKPNSKLVKAKKEWLDAIENQTIRIIYALTRHLTDESPNDAKQRLLVKFLDEDKCDRLVELCLSYDQKARMAEFKFWKSGVEDEINAEEAVQLAALEAKLRGGGDIFHRLGAIAGFCCIGSKRCHERVLKQLSLQKSGIAVIKAALEEFISVLGPGKQADQLKLYFDGV